MKAALFHPAAIATIRSFPEAAAARIRETALRCADGSEAWDAALPAHAVGCAWHWRIASPRSERRISRVLLRKIGARGACRACIHEEDTIYITAGRRNWTPTVEGDAQ